MTAAPFPPTAMQLQLLRFIAGYQRAHGGVSPCLREMTIGIGRTKSNVHRMLTCLAERGLIRRLPNRTRAIELLAPVSIPTAPDGVPLFAVPFQENCHAGT